MVLLAALSSRPRSTVGPDDPPAAELSPRTIGGSSTGNAQRPSALMVFASAASVIYTMMDGAREAEWFAAEVSAKAADRQWLVALGTALREYGGQMGVGCLPAHRQPQTPRPSPAGKTPEHAFAACRAERDRALAEADTLRGRVAELKRSLEYVSNFERWAPPDTGPRPAGVRGASGAATVRSPPRRADCTAAGSDLTQPESDARARAGVSTLLSRQAATQSRTAHRPSHAHNRV